MFHEHCHKLISQQEELIEALRSRVTSLEAILDDYLQQNLNAVPKPDINARGRVVYMDDKRMLELDDANAD